MTVPKLRFKEFDGDWLTTKLGEVVKFSNGKRIPLSETDRQKRQGIYRYYGASGVIDHVDDYIFDGQYILIGEDGANIITRSSTLAFVVEGKFWVNNHAHIFQSKHGDNIFLATYLESLNYERFNSGTAQPKLNLENLKKVPVVNPPISEQTKIATFLSAVEEKISQLTQKHALLSQYKQGMMQKLFSQQIRFKADDGSAFGEWENKALSKFIIKHIGGASLKPSDFVEQSEYEVIPKKAIVPNGYLNLDKDNPTYCSEDFFKANLKNTVDNTYLVTVLRDLVPSGPSIGYIVKYMENTQYILAQGVYGFKLKEELNKDFLIHFSNTKAYRLVMQSIMVGSTQVHIRNQDFFGIEIPVPCLAEQTKIANFLSAIDQKIEVVAQQIEQAKTWKKGLLQQMFV